MIHSTYRISRQVLPVRRWTRALTLFLLASLGLAPLACRPSTADANKEATNAADADSESGEADAFEVPAYTGARTVAQRLSDASLAAQIKQALVRQSDLRIFDFEPEVVGATVTLRGDVNTKTQWAHAEQVAAGVAQGRTVVNTITIGGRPADEVDAQAGEATGQEVSAAAYHTVERGENLWLIARKYGASVQRMRDLNNLSSDALRVGQRLRVR